MMLGIFSCKERKLCCWTLIVDGVVIAGEPYFRRCCEFAEQIPHLFSPHFAIANLDPANLHGLFVVNKVLVFCHFIHRYVLVFASFSKQCFSLSGEA